MTAFYLVFRETLEYSIILMLMIGVYRDYKRALILSACIAVVTGGAVTGLNFPLPDMLQNVYTGFMYYSLVMVLLLSFVAGRKPIYPVIAIFLLLAAPSAQLAAVVMEEALIKGAHIYIYAVASLALIAGILAAGLKYAPGWDLNGFFAPGGIFVFVAAFGLVFGGLKEFDRSSLVTSLQQGLYVFFSSFIPFLKKTLLIPDGPVVETVFDGMFDYFSSQRVSMAVTALILFLPPLFIFVRLLLKPEPDTGEIGKGAERRKTIAVYRDELIKKGAPMVAALLVGVVLLHSANLAARPTYEPEPAPVIPDGDEITVPLIDKFGDISDGRMRKYAFLYEGETYRFIVMMRPDGEVTAVLDACEICPPRGYVQRADHVVCKYCNTPMPALSLGRPGGCNPIPIRYTVKDDALTVSMMDIVNAYKKEAGKETGSPLR